MATQNTPTPAIDREVREPEVLTQADPKKDDANTAISAEPTVMMLFRKKVNLNLGTKVVTFLPGVHEVPKTVSEHWYLKANGVIQYTKTETLKVTTDRSKALAFLTKAGMTLPEAEKVVETQGVEAVLKSRARAEAQDQEDPAPDDSVVTADHLRFLQARGYPFKSLDESKEFYGTMTDRHKVLFLADAKSWIDRHPAPVEEAKAPVVPPAPAVDLDKLTKDEIAAHAKEVHGLDLDPKLKKDEMISAVEKAAAAK